MAAPAIEVPRLEYFAELLKGGKRGPRPRWSFGRLLTTASCATRRRPARRADHPGRGADVWPGRVVPGIGIYAPKGQFYEPVDKESFLYYNETKDGQILEEGITEAGSMSSFIAAGTAYATHGVNMIPFYIYYSMFGFQRIGDLMWLAGDIRAKGFSWARPTDGPPSTARDFSIRTATVCWRPARFPP